MAGRTVTLTLSESGAVIVAGALMFVRRWTDAPELNRVLDVVIDELMRQLEPPRPKLVAGDAVPRLPL